MNIHLVDGTYELFRGFYGPPPKKSPDGREVGATIGLLRSMLALISDSEVTHIACAFDHVIESFRNELYPGYKTGAGIDPDLLAQFSLAEEAVSALGIVIWPMVEFEADDAIATAAVRFKDQPGVDQVVICSPDKDLTQLVSGDHVVCWDPRWSRSTASLPSPSRTISPWWEIRRTASPESPPGAPNRQRNCSPNINTSKPSQTI
jgi:5'-3' exonuclease